MKLAKAALLCTLASLAAWSQTNIGEQKPEASLPFNMTTVATFKLPWRMAFLPDGRMLITEKPGPLWVVSQQGEKIQVENTPPVYFQGQNGMMGVFLSPQYATDHKIYLTYVEPGDYGGGFALGRAKLDLTATSAKLENLEVLWRQRPTGKGGQAGGPIAFSADGKDLFLAVGDRQRFYPAQDPDQPVGKILRLTLDGKPAPGNPNYGKTGAATIPLIDPPRDTEAAKTAKVVSTYTFPGPNLTPAETWATGVRTPYGMAFSPAGELWEVEHGPRGGDELNLIERGKNYGWPLVSYGNNYNGVPIPRPDTRPDLTQPVLYWVPVIAPGNLMFYRGTKSFPQWNGNGFVSGLATQSINRIIFDGHGGAKSAERWEVGHRVRDVEEAPDGSLWMLEDANPGALIHLTPKTAPGR
ncbi:MAG TPA: PQQ-dependent sugar dehydrogenase [Candidatus Sulfopaludibacter sp.]|jgi:glucose/arabinose dehydrogenase|nr:PQQ-dependent sugar dehydrogenase [Candidatus Sulfopaludibacter sp.]